MDSNYVDYLDVTIKALLKEDLEAKRKEHDDREDRHFELMDEAADYLERG